MSTTTGSEGPSGRLKVAIIAGIAVAYALAYGPLFSIIGYSAGMFSTPVVIAAAWLFGGRAGAAAGLLTFPFNTLMVLLSTDAEWSEFVQRGSIPGTGAEVIVGYIVGRLRGLGVSARNELTERMMIEEELLEVRRRLAGVQEAERRDIARELHDEVGQELTGLRLLLESTRNAPPEQAQDRIERGLGLLDGMIDMVRDLSLKLRPSMLDDLGLLPALLWLIEHHTTTMGLRVEFEHNGLGNGLSSEVETAAYRVAQEGLTNVARHAGTAEARLSIRVDDGTLRLMVQDRGAGFNPSAVLSAPDSVGLAGMRERVELLGGRLSVDSAPDQGTSVKEDRRAIDARRGRLCV